MPPIRRVGTLGDHQVERGLRRAPAEDLQEDAPDVDSLVELVVAAGGFDEHGVTVLALVFFRNTSMRLFACLRSRSLSSPRPGVTTMW